MDGTASRMTAGQSAAGGAHGRFGGVYADEVSGGAAWREAALCKRLRTEVDIRHLGAVVAQRCAVHPWHRIAEIPCLPHNPLLLTQRVKGLRSLMTQIPEERQLGKSVDHMQEMHP